MAIRRRLRDWRDFAAYALFGAALGVTIMLADGRISPAMIGGGIGATMLVAGVLACVRGGRVDEFSLASVNFAWLWGGFTGLAIGMGALVWAVLSGGGVAIDLPALDAAQVRAFGGGVLLVIGVQLAAYLLILAGWRLLAWRE